MKILGNIIWLIFGGLISAIGFFLVGLLCCITIIGIPLGKQLFKFASLVLTPFGKKVNTKFGSHPIANTIWLIFIGLWMAIGYVFSGLVLCITIIGIPFGLQAFKFVSLALFPFGAVVE